MSDRRIFVVEDNARYLGQIQETLVKELEEAEPIGESLVERALGRIDDETFMDTIELVIVDLELSGGDASGPADFEGRDLILPRLRSAACWVPVLAMSRYFTGDAHVLAEVTPYGFDAVIPKRFFSESRTYHKQWQRIKRAVAASRVGFLTGRDTQRILQLLEHNLELELGVGVANEIEKYGRVDFEMALRLMELGTDRVVIDEVVQGFSGLSVVKVNCRRGSRRVSWLLKFGSAFRKLAREVSAHRRMFVDGLTRSVSVPVLWWQPLVWGGVGMIAYEFEDDARTLLDEVRARGFASGLGKVASALKELYQGSQMDSVIPRISLREIVDGVALGAVKTGDGELVRALLERKEHPDLDKSLEVMVGPQHGDLHTRNILIGRRGPLLIDFAHYRGTGEGGIPILDLAKLFVDLWAFDAAISLEEILSGNVLEGDEGRSYGSALTEGAPSIDERKFFRMAALCQLAKYSTYEDVSLEKKSEAWSALGVEPPGN